MDASRISLFGPLIEGSGLGRCERGARIADSLGTDRSDSRGSLDSRFLGSRRSFTKASRADEPRGSIGVATSEKERIPEPDRHDGAARPGGIADRDLVSSRTEVTRLLRAVNDGDESACSRLFAVIYDELHRIARAVARKGGSEGTLRPTALVHEVYIRLVGEEKHFFGSRDHFLAYTARAMRSIFIDHLRAKKTTKRNPPGERTALEILAEELDRRARGLERLDEALEKLQTFDPGMVDVIHLRFFVGLSVKETAAVLGTSERSVERDWQVARAWLRERMS